MHQRAIPAAIVTVIYLVSGISSFAAKKQNAATLSKDEKILHALSRLTFGARPGDAERVRALGLNKWIDLQLHPERIPENPVLAEKLRPLDSITMSPAQLILNYPAPGKLKPAMDNNRVRHPLQILVQQLTQAKLDRAVYSNRQLQEVLTDFWYNHFNVFLGKGLDRYLVTSYEQNAIRPHVLGKFEDLLRSVAQSPAMLFYLDNWQSAGPGSPAGERRGRGLNENYGRELMELHTLGVDGGYTQKDVTEVARCFTGWTIRQPRQNPEFQFNPRMHDNGEKTVLGVRIPAGGGIEDGYRVLHILAHHPSTAHFISRELAVRFVSNDPPGALVDSMAATFLKKDGDLCAVMKTMLRSPVFWSREAYRSKMKSPFEMVASSLRALSADVDSGSGLNNQLMQLGEPPYRKSEPTGYSNSGAEWVNSAGLLARMNFSIALVNNQIAGVKVNPGATSEGVTLGSPEFQKK
jgi:uncharacterized protein (DUF1800 family)